MSAFQCRNLGKLLGRDAILTGSSRMCWKNDKGFLTGDSLNKGLLRGSGHF